MILGLLIFCVFSLRSLSFILKLAKYGIISTFLYGIFLIFIFTENVLYNEWKSHMESFTFNFSGIIGKKNWK